MTKELMKAPDTLSVWESNMKELRTLQPKLAGLLDDYVAEHGHEFRHFENKTPAGRWIEGLAAKPFFESFEEPKFEWSRRKRDKDKPVFFLYGVGTPPYLFKAIRQLPDLALSFVVLEPNIELLAYTLHLTHVYLALPKGCRLSFLTEQRPSRKADEEPSALVRKNDEILKEALSHALLHIGIFSAALSLLSGHPGELETFRADFSRISSKVREWIGVQLTFLGNSAEDTLLGVRQIVLLAPWVSFGSRISWLNAKTPDRPVISVAAGPSLDKNFLQLREVQDKCIIIAADAILQKLLDNGIKPHVVTCLERVVETYTLFFSKVVDRYEECKDILLVAQALVVPWVVGRWPGPVCVVGKAEVPVDRWVSKDVLGGEIMPSGTSVAHMNLSIAGILGAPSVAMIGQDLAYAESGESHAGAVEASWNYKEKELADTIEIPGALDGMVKTDRTWLSFLRIIEKMLQHQSFEAWDCTEGGARIAGAKTAPLSQFIAERISDLEPLTETPADIVRQASHDIDRKTTSERVRRFIEEQHAHFDLLNRHLDEVESLVEKATAPGLEPSRRVFFAAAAGRELDKIHARSIVFDFIGQSYTRLASIELSLTRALDTVESVTRWHRMHDEILQSHRAILTFLRKWLDYAGESLERYASKEVDLLPIESKKAWETAKDLFHRLDSAEDEDVISIRLAIDDLIAKCDPVALKWPGHILWNIAMLLMLEGRAALATYFMEAAERDFDGTKMPVDETIAFLKDYARVLIGHDLVHTPQPYQAEIMLANAIELGGVDEEIKKIASEIVENEITYRSMADELFGIKTLDWHRARAEAQKALYDGKLDEALVLVWRAIQENWRDVPGWAASHLDWLATTLEKCREADSSTLVAMVENIIDEIASATELLSNVRITYSRTFAETLAERGLTLQLPVKPDKAADDGEAAEFALPSGQKDV